MLHQSEIYKLPVLDISTGKILGLVRQIIFDPEGMHLAGVGFSTWTWGTRRYICREDIRGIGDHAVTIMSSEVAKPLTAQAELLRLAKNNIPILGSQVITAGGEFLGTVEDYILDPVHYNLIEILLSDSLFQDIFQGFGRVPVHCIMAIGRDAVVVRDNTLSTIKTNKKEALSEPAPRSSEESSSEPTPQDTSRNSDALEAVSRPLHSTSQRPLLIALDGKLVKRQSSSPEPKRHPLMNVRYLRRVDEVLGTRNPSVGHKRHSSQQRPSLLNQVISQGRLWLHKTIGQSKPPDCT